MKTEENYMNLKAQDLDELEGALSPLFPKMFPEDQRFAVMLTRLLARGNPISPAELSAKLQSPVEKVEETLGRRPGVFCDDGGRVVAFWGLSLKPTSHAMDVEGIRLYTWCSWDTLFIPDILGKPARVQSTCPVTGSKIRLTVEPDGVKELDPSDAVTSFLTTDATSIIENIVSNFCHYIYFFPSPETGGQWVSENKGTFLLSIEDAYNLGRRKNQIQYPDVLNLPPSEG